MSSISKSIDFLTKAFPLNISIGACPALLNTFPSFAKIVKEQKKLARIILTHNQYLDILPKLRRVTYDTYLKVQGIEEEVKNYEIC